ncbi:MAG: serine hydrolase domain-containing protein [Verrucomicrobiota bacterium]
MANAASLQSRLEALLRDLVATGTERGAQVAVYHRGELIADAWGGTTDASGQVPIDGETLFPVFSVTKGITSTLVHRLVERGQLDCGAPLARYWPEYGCRGKEAITIGQALSHQAGLPQMPGHLRLGDLPDWDRVCAALAELEPLWAPGSRHEYHAMSWGWLVGEPACRVTGLDFPTLLEREIKAPLGIERLFIGCPRPEDDAIATLEDPFAPSEFPRTDRPESIPWWTQPLYDLMNRDEARRACMPGASGLMNARSIARVYAALAPRGVDGVRLLSPATVARAKAPIPLPDGSVPEHGLGYLLGTHKAVMGNRPGTFGHGGHGGSFGYYDPELDLAFGFTHNRLTRPDDVPDGGIHQVAAMVRASLAGSS